MASFVDYLDEEEAKKKPEGANAGSLSVSRSSATSSPGGTVSASAGANQQGAGSGKFVNFERIINANADAASRTATNLASGVENAGNQAKEDGNSLVNSFAKDVQAGTHTYDGEQQKVDRSVPTTTYDSDSRTLNTQNTVQGGTVYSQEQAAENAKKGYSGPQDVTAYNGFQAVNDSINGASRQATGIADGDSRATMLSAQNAPEQNYTSGMAGLDSALSGAFGNKRFGQIEDTFGDLDKWFSGETEKMGASVQSAIASSDAAASQWQSALDAAIADDEAQSGRNTAARDAQAVDQAQDAIVNEADAFANSQKGQDISKGVVGWDVIPIDQDIRQYNMLTPEERRAMLERRAAEHGISPEAYERFMQQWGEKNGVEVKDTDTGPGSKFDQFMWRTFGT